MRQSVSWRSLLESLRKSIPSFNALIMLEATARHRSVTLAAKELGVTQAAVSHQIAAVEAQLGTQLFIRRHRSIEPTPVCATLVTSLASSFAAIRQSVEQAQSFARTETVTLGASLSFASLWLLPRLSVLRQQFPFIQVRVVSQNARFNLNAGEVDLAVRFGIPPFEDAELVSSRSDLIFPVCSPALSQTFHEPETFLQAPRELIENEVSDRSWYSWNQWFAEADSASRVPSPTLRFNHYTDALEAAKMGQGVVLGWNILIADLLKQRSLVRLGDIAIKSKSSYNVVLPHRTKQNATSRLIAGWLAETL